MDWQTRFESKLDALSDKQGEMNVTLAKQEVNIDKHIKRTEMLEADMVPIKAHVQFVNNIFIFCGALAVMAGFAEAVKYLFFE